VLLCPVMPVPVTLLDCRTEETSTLHWHPVEAEEVYGCQNLAGDPREDRGHRSPPVVLPPTPGSTRRGWTRSMRWHYEVLSEWSLNCRADEIQTTLQPITPHDSLRYSTVHISECGVIGHSHGKLGRVL